MLQYDWSTAGVLNPVEYLQILDTCNSLLRALDHCCGITLSVVCTRIMNKYKYICYLRVCSSLVITPYTTFVATLSLKLTVFLE